MLPRHRRELLGVGVGLTLAISPLTGCGSGEPNTPPSHSIAPNQSISPQAPSPEANPPLSPLTGVKIGACAVPGTFRLDLPVRPSPSADDHKNMCEVAADIQDKVADSQLVTVLARSAITLVEGSSPDKDSCVVRPVLVVKNNIPYIAAATPNPNGKPQIFVARAGEVLSSKQFTAKLVVQGEGFIATVIDSAGQPHTQDVAYISTGSSCVRNTTHTTT
jgi:hypothetical protein